MVGITNGTGSTGSTGGTNSEIANDALKYVGGKYVWGGAVSTAKGSQPMSDCSGFVNAVLGRDLGKAIPGYAAGQFNGGSHGPSTLSYLAWSGATTVSGGASAAQAGDLLCWASHIGIALGGGQMVSALDTADGVKQTDIPGGSPTGEPLTVRRVN
jgi:cell wall-associated NlpC family hydrolase